jgi:hypothetical protein
MRIFKNAQFVMKIVKNVLVLQNLGVLNVNNQQNFYLGVNVLINVLSLVLKT